MRNLFVRWYLNVCATLVGLGLAYYFGFLHLIWESDQTKITSVIAGLWLLATLLTGWCERGEIKKSRSGRQSRFTRWTEFRMKHVKFISETCATLGMIGTIIGFMMMAQGSGLVDADSTSALKESVRSMLSGFGVAMMTTLVGACAKLSIDSQIVSRS